MLVTREYMQTVLRSLREKLRGFYSPENQPPYPVMSVNGETGNVNLAVPTKTSDLENDSDFLEEKIFDSYSAAADYAENDPNAHLGVSLTVVDAENDTVTVYVIANSRGELAQIGWSSSMEDYNALANKPQINGVALVGNKSSADLDLETGAITNSEIEEIFNS